MTRRRTWWHLGADRRIPSRYDVVSGRLLRHPGAGLEVRLPFGTWYDRYQRGSALTCEDWDAFRDPRETTYASYTRQQAGRAVHVDMLFDGMPAGGPPAAVAAADTILAPALHPLHGLQMVSAYLGQLAPSGRLAIAFLFQSSDLMRRVECGARMVHHLDAGADRRRLWEEGPAWQALRQAIEKLLVTWDWGESFVAANLLLVPLLPALLDRLLAPVAPEILRSLGEDARWQLDWTAQLVHFLAKAHPGNLEALRRWLIDWQPRCEQSLTALAADLSGGDDALAATLAAHRDWLAALDLA